MRVTGNELRIASYESRVASHEKKRKKRVCIMSYRDSKIYQLAHRLAVELHPVTLELPRFELYEEGSQR